MLNFVCALDCEARPLIDFYKLRSRPDLPGVKMYESENMRLIVSGMGKTAAASAVGYVAAQSVGQCSAWLNVGIAGHRNAATGHLFVAGKITDQASGYQVYPPLLFRQRPEVCELISHDNPQTTYPDTAMLDMEAAAFHQAAARFSSVELIHSCKVISDNETSSADDVNAAQVTALIKQKMPDIDQLVQMLQSLLDDISPDSRKQEWMNRLLNAVHFSQYQRKQLDRLLSRWLALNSQQALPDLSAERDARTVLLAIERLVSAKVLELTAC